jgi:hypothetical protein
MAKTFDKHGWLRAVQASTNPVFSNLEYRIASIICTQFTWRDGRGWVFDTDDVAKACPTSPSFERSRKAMAKLCAAGFLVETYRRNTGPGLTSQRKFDLRNTGTPASDCSEEHRDASAEHRDANKEHRDATTEHRDQTDRTPGPDRPNTGTPASSQTPSDQAEGASQGIYEGIKEDVYQGIYQGDLQGGSGRGEEPTDYVPQKRPRCGDCSRPIFNPAYEHTGLCQQCTQEREQQSA